MTANITRFIKISLFSSPWVLKHDLKSVSETGEEFCKDFGYNIHFHKSQAERQETLIPLFEELEQFNNLEFAINYDKKLRNFLNIVNSALSKRMKVIVFVERKPTAIYLEEMLRHFSPQAKINNIYRAMLKGLSYGALGLLVAIQKQYDDRPFLLKDVLNRGESSSSTKRLLRELVDEGFLSSGQLRQAATGYFSVPQYRLINSLPIAFMDEEVDPSATLRVNTERSRGVELEPQAVPVS